MKETQRTRKLTDQEIDDCITALQFFIENYPDKDGSKECRRDMKKLIKKLWGTK